MFFCFFAFVFWFRCDAFVFCFRCDANVLCDVNNARAAVQREASFGAAKRSRQVLLHGTGALPNDLRLLGEGAGHLTNEKNARTREERGTNIFC